MSGFKKGLEFQDQLENHFAAYIDKCEASQTMSLLFVSFMLK